MSDKKTILSCIQPTGIPTLGNYLGALKNWVKLSEDFDSIFAIADMHAITVRFKAADLRKQVREMCALLIAIGLDPKKSLLFIQSHVSAHAELAWILNCYTQFGELSRMTQFKDKSARHSDNVNLGLFAYPSLMAADILLYQAHFVPVGADQKQHLELTRDIAERFNSLYGDVFTVPEPYIEKSGARIMALQNPEKKMSKSDDNANNFILMLDSPDIIMKKFKRAVTDSEAKVRYAEGKDGINNLMAIYSTITGKSYEDIETEFDGKGYGDFKTQVGEAVIEELRPIQERYAKLINDKEFLENSYKEGAEKAALISRKTLAKAKRKVGLL